MTFILQWIDGIWLPLALVVVRKDQRFWVLAILAANMLMLRMLVELMHQGGYSQGIFGLMAMPALHRGMLVYNILDMLYLLYACIGRMSGALFMGASLSFFFIAAVTSAIVMVL
jgi:hypothetical protein